MRPDEKDMAIIKVLQKDGRATVKEISQRTGIRPSTVHSRLRGLESDGLIEGYRVKLDDERFDRGFGVYLLISGTTEKYIDDKTLHHPAVTVVSGLTGEYDILVKCKFKDLAEFNAFLLDFRERHAGGVVKTVTMVETVRLKEEL